MADKRTVSVIDTNVFLSTGDELFHKLDNRDIVIPLVVYKEIEKYRTNPGGLGRSARTVIRFLESLRTASAANMSEIPAPIPGTTNTVRIEIDHKDQSKLDADIRDERSNDTIIMAVARNLAADGDLELITNDAPLRFLASVAAGIHAIPYDTGDHESFDGIVNVEAVNADDGDAGDSPAGHLVRVARDDPSEPFDDEDVVAAIDAGYRRPPSNALAIIDHDDWRELRLKRTVGDRVTVDNFDEREWRSAGPVKPRNLEQALASEWLNDPNIQMLSLGGVAGGGKSLLTIAYGLDAVRHQQFDHVTVFRSMYAVGRQDAGFLPGDIDDKMRPWAQAVWDSVRKYDSLLGRRGRKQTVASDGVPKTLEDRYANMITISPLTWIRGRTFENQLIIVDDAQSLDRSVLLDMVSRLGSGSKIVFTFDMDQQDNPYLSKGTSIVSLVNRLKSEPLFAHVEFVKSERSDLAQLAGRLLKELD